MTPLRLVKPTQQERLTVEDLLRLLSPEHFDAIEHRVRTMRESYACPFTVRDYHVFKQTLFGFFTHYQQAFFGADHAVIKEESARRAWTDHAYTFCERHLGGYHGGMRAAERNAITGREGGMIGVIDALTDGIGKLHLETYIHGVFFDQLGYSDVELRFRLAKELLDKYGSFLFPGEELQHYAILGSNLEAFVHGFVTHLHALRREWRH